MNRKKVFGFIIISILVAFCILAYIFKSITTNAIYNKPNFRGTILEVFNNGILVSVNANENEFKCSDRINVSLNNINKSDIPSFSAGEKVIVFYDGTILESYPAQIHTAYTISLINE